jgi:hypothetical protein
MTRAMKIVVTMVPTSIISTSRPMKMKFRPITWVLLRVRNVGGGSKIVEGDATRHQDITAHRRSRPDRKAREAQPSTFSLSFRPCANAPSHPFGLTPAFQPNQSYKPILVYCPLSSSLDASFYLCQIFCS